jgi:hypothetical protein
VIAIIAKRSLSQVSVLVEKRDFVFIGYLHFAVAFLALEAVGHHEPLPFLDFRMTTVLTFQGEVHVQ